MKKHFISLLANLKCNFSDKLNFKLELLKVTSIGVMQGDHREFITD